MAVIRNKKDKSWNWFKELGLKEHTLYEVRVKARANNPAYHAFLFVGFKNGNYTYIYTNSTDATPLNGQYSIHIIRELAPLKGYNAIKTYGIYEFVDYYLEDYGNDYDKCMESIKRAYKGRTYTTVYKEHDAIIEVEAFKL